MADSPIEQWPADNVVTNENKNDNDGAEPDTEPEAGPTPRRVSLTCAMAFPPPPTPGTEGSDGADLVGMVDSVQVSPFLSLAKALQLLALPREVGLHPDTDQPITVGIGRYGPYIRLGSRYKSLPAGEDLLAMDTSRGVELINELKLLSGPSANDPDDSYELGLFEGKALKLKKKGRFGPYLNWGKLNVGIPESLHEVCVCVWVVGGWVCVWGP